MRQAFRVRPFEPADQEGVEALVLGIQRDEFGLSLMRDNQPDLKDVGRFFSAPGSGFWVAVDPDSDAIVGCIGLEAVPGGTGAMRKFMVARQWRGLGAGVAEALHSTFVAHAAAVGPRAIILATVTSTQAAQRFYERAGYRRVKREELPAAYSPGVLDTVFMQAPVRELLQR
jgi:ribosomal protein S18 acetylase RimI-like enzyme